jgi:MFS family permease
MQLTTLNFGVALVYWIDYAFTFHNASYAWRVPVILQCIFLIPMLVLLTIIPETPRWLAAHDRPEEALAVLRRLKGGTMEDSAIVQLHRDIVRTVALEISVGAGSWKDLLKNDRIQSQRRLLIACGIQIFQQLGGINAVICGYPPPLYGHRVAESLQTMQVPCSKGQ